MPPPSTTPPALPPITPHAIRDELTSIVVNDLLGPAGGPEEELDQREDRVTGRYLIGMLATRSTSVEAEEQDALGTDQQDDPEAGATDASTPPRATFFPNSIGLSFVVESEAKAILIKAEWGRYRRVKSATQTNKRTGAEALVWKREAFTGEPLVVPLRNGMFGPLQPRSDSDPAVEVQGKMRPTPRGWVVTVFLVNTQPEQDRKEGRGLGVPAQGKRARRRRAAAGGFRAASRLAARPHEDGLHHTRGNGNFGDALPAPAGVRRRAWCFGAYHAAGAGNAACGEDRRRRSCRARKSSSKHRPHPTTIRIWAGWCWT